MCLCCKGNYRDRNNKTNENELGARKGEMVSFEHCGPNDSFSTTDFHIPVFYDNNTSRVLTHKPQMLILIKCYNYITHKQAYKYWEVDNSGTTKTMTTEISF